jgi:hypothetical protein
VTTTADARKRTQTLSDASLQARQAKLLKRTTELTLDTEEVRSSSLIGPLRYSRKAML